MTRPSEEIEREVEATRDDLDRTLGALKEKMTPGQLLDELTNSFGGSGASDMLSNLGKQARDNPMALAMVGAGLAWLMAGKGSHPSVAAAGDPYEATMGGRLYSSDANAGEGDRGDGLLDKATDAARRAAAAASEAKDRVLGIADDTARNVGDVSAQMKHATRDLSDRAAQNVQSLQQGFMNILDREPLIVGAVGVAVGAAIGAALPSTPTEDRAFGRARDRLMDKSANAGQDALQGAKAAVSAALDSAREEADRQGLGGSGDGGSVVDKVESVVRAGVEAGREEIAGGRTN